MTHTLLLLLLLLLLCLISRPDYTHLPNLRLEIKSYPGARGCSAVLVTVGDWNLNPNNNRIYSSTLY